MLREQVGSSRQVDTSTSESQLGGFYSMPNHERGASKNLNNKPGYTRRDDYSSTRFESARKVITRNMNM